MGASYIPSQWDELDPITSTCLGALYLRLRGLAWNDEIRRDGNTHGEQRVFKGQLRFLSQEGPASAPYFWGTSTYDQIV